MAHMAHLHWHAWRNKLAKVAQTILTVTQAPEKAAGRGRMALQGRVEVAERPGQGTDSRRGGAQARQRGREEARRQATRPRRGRQAEQRGQRGGGARAGVLVLGRGPHGGRRLAGAPRTYPGLSRNPRARRASAPIRGFFSCGGDAATHAHRQTNRRGRPEQRDAPAHSARRANIKLPAGRRSDTRCQRGLRRR